MHSKLNEFKYFQKGIVYTVTDIEDLHNWMATHFEEFQLFERVTESEYVIV